MTLQQLLDNLTPQIVGSLKRAIELGKWPNGQSLTDQQRSLCAEAVANWEAKNVPAESRIGYVPPKKTACGDQDDEKPLTWA
ncbi:hypothetical protein AUP74_01406 [Microbulbifer aggregans]|uniref:PA-phosphatase n=1 Tax=Microbulbifer aggregans TaxID=1769779 RepID=A0A1C9W6S4_9GAMM|nr:DUF1315 family protein [Microbulbifer aggregans]AOS96854.1 hypothetical protein AUP74_01406 [Microbulbifer aggregans]